MRRPSGAFISAGVQASRRRLEMIAAVEKRCEKSMCCFAPAPWIRRAGSRMRLRPSHLSAAGTHPVTGHPALAMMAGLSSGGLVLSVQFVGRHFAEATLFQVAHAWERAADTNQRHPPID
jgi:aspartyl-tRNA(Asn)/glutamyl-tRNA(Gln) amidotransferase subunit A